MPFLIPVHAFFAFATLISGVFVYTQKDSKLWQTPRIWLYLIPHLITAITGLFFGKFNQISIFKALAILTIFQFIRILFLMNKKDFDKPKFIMFGAYVGLCIAFVGTLHPERLLGNSLFVESLNLSVESSEKIWIVAMILSGITAIILAISSIENRIKIKKASD